MDIDPNILTKKQLIEHLETVIQERDELRKRYGSASEVKHLSEIAAFTRAYGWIPPKDLYYNNCHNIMTEKDFKTAIYHGLSGGLLKLTSQNDKIGLSPKQQK